ncbi:MAG: sodium:proton antiporter, partial [Pseudomonadota bacterium]
MHHEGLDPVVIFALIGVLGVGSQWLAWRFSLPAIVLMLAAGLVAGPVTGVLNPAEDLGDLMRPMVAIAVAIILFEGGLTLNLKSLSDASLPVKRLVFVGAPVGWLLSTLTAHYAGGLSWESAVVFGGILIVTGPTVIQPLLRQAALASRPASILKWEAIVNDPIGALAAVLAFEVVSAFATEGSLIGAAEHLIVGIAVATVAGFAAGWAIVWTFQRGHVPEYMKVPVLFGAVLAVYAGSDMLLHESGLLAVTIMGLYIANSHLPSFAEILRFKEHATVLLVSGVFILLAASLTVEMLLLLDWRAVAFVAVTVFVARPLTVALSLIGTDLPRNERIMVAWIGPRGVVLVAVAGLFGTRLEELGVPDGPMLAPLSFALVAATVVLHGFSMAPLGRALGIGSKTAPGLLIAGGAPWTVGLAGVLKDAEVPVLIADRNWFRLRSARQAKVPVFFGEVLSEAAEHSLDPNAYAFVLAA